MAAVTQLTPSFLGGVSRQSDDKKKEGALTDILNGYSDPTYGLVKRGGTRFLWNLKKANDTNYTNAELEDAFWFIVETTTEVTVDNQADYPLRSVGDIFTHPFFGCIAQGNIYLWDSFNGNPQAVTNNGSVYLTRPNGTEYYGTDDFHYRAILDTVIICNKNVKTAMQPATGGYTPGLVGTIRLNNVNPNVTYTATINGTDCDFASPAQTGVDIILDGLKAKIESKNLGVTVKKYKTSLELSKGSAFTLSVKDTYNNSLMNSYQDSALSLDLLAKPSKDKRIVKIANTSAAEDDYWVDYNAAKADWEETTEPGISPGFDDSTMPHRLYRKPDGTWEFGPIPWDARLVGSETNNPAPSFINQPIKASFYYNDRLGFLSYANVVMSRTKSVYNFFAETQLTSLDTDPIDVNANTTRPCNLFEVIVQQQGVVLFGTRQQFYLSAPETGVLTPSRALIKQISNYEINENIAPLDIGTTIGFVSRMPDYSRLMLMQGDGLEVDPVVVDISKVVTGWLPKVTIMSASPQNSFVALADRNTRNLYIYRFYNDGQEDKMQAWQRWELQGNIKACTIADDLMYFITEQSGVHSTSVISLNELDTLSYRISDKNISAASPAIDFLSQPSSVVYNAATDKTKLYIKFPTVNDLKPIAILTLPTSGINNQGSNYIDLFKEIDPNPSPDVLAADPGFYQVPTVGDDATGDYFEVDGDWSGYTGTPESGIAVGYRYNYEVTLPTFYFRLAAKNQAADYTASLTVNRVKFAIGKTGAVEFKLKTYGRDEWENIQPITTADYYQADTEAVVSEQQFTVPINQRNKHFQLKVTSDMPFPVSLVSMMWEGQYTPRFYRRL